MSVSKDCFDYIIGLSRTTCDCYSPPADYNLSYSGLYLDELESLRMLTSMENCENGNDVWDLLDKSRDEGILQFIADANMELQKLYRLKRRPFYGTVGTVKYTKTLSLTTNYYAGVRWMCADIVSGIAKIKKIGTLFATTGTIDLLIYNNKNEHLGTYTLNTVANTVTSNSVDIELPLHEDYIDNIEYFFVYKVSLQPKNNQLTRCCNTRYRFNAGRPYFTQTNKQFGWANYVMVGGYYRSSIDDLDDCSTTANDMMYGLVFDVEFKCKVNEVLCKDYLDFDANPLALSMAHAVRYKAGELLINKLELSPNLNRETLINKEAIAAAREVFVERYNKIMEYIIKTIDVTTTDCLECREWQQVLKGGILS